MAVKEEKEEEAPISKLLSNELFWAEQHEFLQSKGYELRPRYQPGFKATFTSGEPALALSDPNVMDAIRIRDSKKVLLKYMSPSETKQTREISPQYKDDAQNHSVPIIDFLVIGKEGYRIAVMPFLRDFDDPQFLTTGEVLEAVNQFLEGLEFMHKKNFAHRDACSGNMMMDATEVIPKGWHIVAPWTEDGSKPITSVPRSSVSVKYHFIDFGLSIFVNPEKPTATGAVGQDRTVPEFENATAEYNPLKLDIYQLGNAFKNRLVQQYNELDFLLPLVTAMTQKNPEDRPTASEARELFASIAKDVDSDTSVTLRPGAKLRGPNPPRTSLKSSSAVKPKKATFFKNLFVGIYTRAKRVFRF